jgi:hypothetical protein
LAVKSLPITGMSAALPASCWDCLKKVPLAAAVDIWNRIASGLALTIWEMWPAYDGTLVGMLGW